MAANPTPTAPPPEKHVATTGELTAGERGVVICREGKPGRDYFIEAKS